jgi:hypothetical protein
MGLATLISDAREAGSFDGDELVVWDGKGPGFVRCTIAWDREMKCFLGTVSDALCNVSAIGNTRQQAAEKALNRYLEAVNAVRAEFSVKVPVTA